MPINYFLYNRSEEVIPQLSEALNKTGNVLRPHFLVRSHAETSEWLTRELARKSGIAANLH